MSRVQKKPIRRRLKDVTLNTDEAEPPEETSFVPKEPVKSTIPRSPRPEIASKPTVGKPPVRRVSRAFASAPIESDERAFVSQNHENVRNERPKRVERPERAEHFQRSEKVERTDGFDNNDRFERAERIEKPGSGDRFVGCGNTRDTRSRDNGRNGRENGRDKNRGDRNGRFGGRNDRNGKGGFGGRKPGEKKKKPEKIVYEKTKQFVFPGQAIGAIEEYNPGFGTVNDDGTIRATVPGVVGYNKENRLISVIPKTKTPNTITEGDIVIASVTDVRESNARVDIVAAEKSLDEEIVNNGNAEVYVSNIKDGFAKSVGDEFHIGDIIRAKVIDCSKIGLSTVEPEFGVLKAYCSRCKTSLTRSGDSLVCGNCGNQERRKLADGYGRGISSAL